MCSFLQYPITFSHNNTVLISTNTVPKPSLQSTLNAMSIKILQKHTHGFTFQYSGFQKYGGGAKYYEAAVSITAN